MAQLRVTVRLIHSPRTILRSAFSSLQHTHSNNLDQIHITRSNGNVSLLHLPHQNIFFSSRCAPPRPRHRPLRALNIIHIHKS